MKYWIYTLSVLMISIAANAQTWTEQISNVTADLKGVYFGTTQDGVAVGLNGAITKTSDGGATWTSQFGGGTAHLFGVHYSSTQRVYAVGAGGTIIASTNGGIQWNVQNSGTTNILYDVFFASQTIGWAVGENGIILHTMNAGNTWSAQTSGTSEILNSVFFISTTEGWAAGNDNTVLHTTDMGMTWTPQSAPYGSYRDVRFISATKGWLCGGGSGTTIVTTDDGGQTWTQLPYGFTPYMMAIHFVTPQIGWGIVATAVNNYNTLRYSADGGNSWTQQNTPIPLSGEDIFFFNASNGWLVGSGGKILKYSTPVGLNESVDQSLLFSPNPTSDFLEVSHLEQPSMIEISDLQGRVVFQQMISSANKKIDLYSLSANLYLVKISNAAGSTTAKLLKY